MFYNRNFDRREGTVYASFFGVGIRLAFGLGHLYCMLCLFSFLDKDDYITKVTSTLVLHVVPYIFL